MIPLYSQTMSELENLGTRPTGEHVSHPQCGFMNVIRKVKEARRRAKAQAKAERKRDKKKRPEVEPNSTARMTSHEISL